MGQTGTDTTKGAGDEWWVFMWAKVRILSDHRVELYHWTDTDTGKELRRLILPRQAIWTADAALLRAIATRETVRVEVDFLAVLEAKRELK